MCDPFNKIKNIMHQTKSHTHYNIIVSTYERMKNSQTTILASLCSPIQQYATQTYTISTNDWLLLVCLFDCLFAACILYLAAFCVLSRSVSFWSALLYSLPRSALSPAATYSLSLSKLR